MHNHETPVAPLFPDRKFLGRFPMPEFVQILCYWLDGSSWTTVRVIREVNKFLTKMPYRSPVPLFFMPQKDKTVLAVQEEDGCLRIWFTPPEGLPGFEELKSGILISVDDGPYYRFIPWSSADQGCNVQFAISRSRKYRFAIGGVVKTHDEKKST